MGLKQVYGVQHGGFVRWLMLQHILLLQGSNLVAAAKPLWVGQLPNAGLLMDAKKAELLY